MRKVTLPVTFEVGSLEEIGIGGLKQPWVAAKQTGMEFDLTCGAGLGNSLMEATVFPEKGRKVYARTNISDLASALWTEMKKDIAD